jgi:hypothetical protein
MSQNPDDARKYIETSLAQKSKKTGNVCGDYVLIERTTEATTIILADGIGSGIKAHIAAVMCASRLMELIRLGFTLREACRKIVDTMHEAGDTLPLFQSVGSKHGHAIALLDYSFHQQPSAAYCRSSVPSMGLEMSRRSIVCLNTGTPSSVTTGESGLGHLFALAGAQRTPVICEWVPYANPKGNPENWCKGKGNFRGCW